MRSLIATLLALTLSGAAPRPVAHPVRVHGELQAMTVTFILPHGDDKDGDTRLAVAVTRSGLAVARHDDIAHDQHFSDPGTYGPYPLNVQTAVSQAVVQGSMTTVTIAPNGHDRWITAARIDARFNDGTTMTCSSSNFILDQDNRSVTFQNC